MTQADLKALPYWEALVKAGHRVYRARAALKRQEERHKRVRELLAKEVQAAELEFVEAEGAGAPGGAS